MNRNFITCITVCTLLFHPPFAFGTPKEQRPNLVVILIDDMGWNDTGFAGNKTVHTPNMDRLAKNGIIFSEAYASAPNCAPTRACLMTGQYPPRHGIYTVVDERHSPGQPNHKIISATSKSSLDGEAITIAEVLHQAGYATGMVGMWNLGKGRKGPQVPTGQGFDSYVQPKDLGFERDAYFNAAGEYLTDKLTDAAIDYVKNQRGPFFLYLANHCVHSPFQPKPELLQKNGGDEYAATIEALDENIGRFAAALPQDTLVIFTSDNGATRQHAAPLNGGKGTLYEGGTRVPSFAYGPGIHAGQTTAEPVSTIDLFPTLLELAATPLPEDLIIDGKSMVPLWNNGTLHRDTLYWHFPCYIGQGGPTSALRDGDYKLIEFFETGTIELYNLKDDPEEKNNLTAKDPARAKQLYEKLKAWQKSTGAPCPSEPNLSYDPTAANKKDRNLRGKGGKE
jgi:arylsulfatase A-like enzyme